MKVEVVTDNEVSLVKMVGSVDDHGVRELKADLAKHAVRESFSVMFGFGAVTHICSSGIGALLEFYTEQSASGGVMSIEGMSQSIYDTFSRVKLDLVLDITPPR